MNAAFTHGLFLRMVHLGRLNPLFDSFLRQS